ncbi:hypothetical protein QZH41_009941 [Actinostola sp. cb2023]|nr:hypothetical protein QZH41_009941 [Actinostola sp. cb2023]
MSLVGGHEDRIKCCSWSPSGHYVASSSADGRIALWEPRSGTALTRIKAYEDSANSVKFYPLITDNSVPLLFSVGGRTCNVWHPFRQHNKQLLSVKMNASGQEIQALGISPDGSLLATGGSDKIVSLSTVDISLDQIDALPIETADRTNRGTLLWKKYTRKVIEHAFSKSHDRPQPTTSSDQSRNSALLVGMAVHRSENVEKHHVERAKTPQYASEKLQAEPEVMLQYQRQKLRPRSEDLSTFHDFEHKTTNDAPQNQLQNARQHLRKVRKLSNGSVSSSSGQETNEYAVFSKVNGWNGRQQNGYTSPVHQPGMLDVDDQTVIVSIESESEDVNDGYQHINGNHDYRRVNVQPSSRYQPFNISNDSHGHHDDFESTSISLKEEFLPEKSELFQYEVFLEEVSDVICIAQAELPSLLPLEQLAETLLRVKYGPWLLCRLVVNIPDKFEQGSCHDAEILNLSWHYYYYSRSSLCSALLANGEVQDDNSLGGMMRTQALRQLCTMNPSYAVVMQAEAIRHCRLPGLAVVLALDFGYDESTGHSGNLVAFLSGLILSSDLRRRNWFAEFIKIGQKSSSSILHSLRSQLLKETLALVPNKTKQDVLISEENLMESTHVEETHQDKETMEILQAMQVNTDFEIVDEGKTPEPVYPRTEIYESLEMSEDNVIRGSALLKLYCALKNLAGMKFTHEEAEALLTLITCHAPPTAAGVRFLVVGLCTLLACPQIISTPEHEQRVIHLIKWLSKEESHYETASGVHASFGEILLLISIHFHSNQPYSIVELVSSILSIKIKAAPLSRIKSLFTQELFPEKVITSHAVTVPVTPQLNGHVSGFLPIHCIQQLLKSRTFTKHYVPVKNWVYQQLCNCSVPLHPLVPSLVDVFVSAVINPTGKAFQEGFTEAEIQAVFKGSKDTAVTTTIDRRPSVYIGDEQDTKSSLTSRLLMLYYVLLYQDYLLNNIKTTGKFDFNLGTLNIILVAFSLVHENPSMAVLVLMKLSKVEPSGLIVYTDAVVTSLPLIIKPSIPRRIQSLCCHLWSKISTIIPRKLWLATINVLCHDGRSHAYTEEELIRDPLTVLRCNSTIFRCPPVFDILVRILQGYLAASRTMLSQHLQANPVTKQPQSGFSNSTSACNREQEREELRVALAAAQESAAIQLLLEICLPSKLDKQEGSSIMHGCILREIQCRVCSSLHQMFIADPSIAKLVHFQGYPAELLPITIAGVPSMHICLAFIAELVNQPQIEKQLFAIQLASYLAPKYPLPKAMGVAKYIFSRLTSLLAALPSNKLTPFFIPALPTIVRFCQAFPPLFGDATVFLVQLGKVAASNVKDSGTSTVGTYNSLLSQLTQGLSPDDATAHEDHGFTEYEEEEIMEDIDIDCSDDIKLCKEVKKTFGDLLKKSALKKYELLS